MIIDHVHIFLFFYRGYESGSGAGGCSGLFCWNSRRPHGRRKVGCSVLPLKGTYIHAQTMSFNRESSISRALLHVRPKVDDFLCWENVLNPGGQRRDSEDDRNGGLEMFYYI